MLVVHSQTFHLVRRFVWHHACIFDRPHNSRSPLKFTDKKKSVPDTIVSWLVFFLIDLRYFEKLEHHYFKYGKLADYLSEIWVR